MANYAEAVERYIASAEYFVRDHLRRKAIRNRLKKVRHELTLQICLSYELLLSHGAGRGEANFDAAERDMASQLCTLAWATCIEDDVQACLAAVNEHLAVVASFFYGPSE